MDAELVGEQSAYRTRDDVPAFGPGFRLLRSLELAFELGDAMTQRQQPDEHGGGLVDGQALEKGRRDAELVGEGLTHYAAEHVAPVALDGHLFFRALLAVRRQLTLLLTKMKKRVGGRD
jgi:hypothetical protein